MPVFQNLRWSNNKISIFKQFSALELNYLILHCKAKVIEAEFIFELKGLGQNLWKGFYVGNWKGVVYACKSLEI